MLNETISTALTVVLDNTLSCVTEDPDNWGIYLLATIGFFSIIITFVRAIFTTGITSIVYIIATIKWIWNRIRGRSL